VPGLRWRAALVDQWQASATFPYKSCLVTTGKKFSFRFGYVQTRDSPPTRRSGPLWLVPTDGSRRPEIDIPEVLVSRPTPT
jgi:hypothetical protein